MIIRPQRRNGFTLIEIIIVVMLIGMIMAWGMPTFVQTFRRAPLQQSVNDFMDACKSARAAAIFSGAPAELVVSVNESQLITLNVQRSASAATTIDPLTGEASAGGSNGGYAFNGTLAEGVGLEMLAVNFIDVVKTGGSSATVKFFPNGTSEEFTAILFEPSTNKRRMIQLDVVTGLATLRTEEEIAQLPK